MKLLQNPPLWRAVLVLMVAVLALIGFWPAPVDGPAQEGIAKLLDFLHARGMPRWINYLMLEKSANVALFMPFGFAASLSCPDKWWWQNTALGLAMSGSMELGQLLFLQNRFSSAGDLVTNFTGCLIGALLALAALRSIQQQRSPTTTPTNSGRPNACQR